MPGNDNSQINDGDEKSGDIENSKENSHIFTLAQYRLRTPFPSVTEISDAGIHRFFMRLEAWFNTQGISSISNEKKRDQEMYNALITNMDDRLFQQVQSVVSNPPEDGKYQYIKSAIVSRFAESAITRLERLSHGIQLGDQKPSHLLTLLQHTNATTDESVVKGFWIQRLPPQARAVVAGIEESQPQITLQNLAAAADAITEALRNSGASSFDNNSVNAVSQNTSGADRIGQLEHTIQSLCTKVDELMKTSSKSKAKRSRSRSRDSRNYGERSCWYHHKFGSKAVKCSPPCKFSDKSKNL